MIVSQPDRLILQRQIRKHAASLRGDLLDVGAGRSRRYQSECVNVTSYKTMDHDGEWKPDIVGSAEAIPLPDASVDSILCTQVFEHLPHPHVAIRELFRVLRPGGRCLFSVPQMNELHEMPNDFFRYTNEGLRVLFTDAGFVIEDMDARGKYFSTMAQMRIRHMIDTWRPYERKWAMLFVSPLSNILTRWALFRDAHSTSAATSAHTIGWCLLAKKP